MARKKQQVIKQPVIVKVGKCGEFEVTYRRVRGDEGPAAEFFGFVDGKRVKILRFDDFEHDPHYHYNPDTPKDKKYSIDPLVIPYPNADLQDIMFELPTMVKAAGYPKLATRIRRWDKLSALVDAINQTIEAMDNLRAQEKRQAKLKSK